VGPAGATGIIGATGTAGAESVNARSTSYTLVSGDANNVVSMTAATASSVTIPANADVPYPIGTHVDIVQQGAGQVTVLAAAGVTLDTGSTGKLRAQYSGATIMKIATNEWVLVGDLEPAGQTVGTQTGTTYTLAMTDAWRFLLFNNAAAITVTIPANATVAFPIGTHIDLGQWGVGQVTVAITTDTLRATPVPKFRAQYSVATLIKTGTTEWVLAGDLAAS
jgi:hypothetical protein